MAEHYCPPEMWDTQPLPGKFMVFVDSKLSSIALTVHPSRPIEDKILIVGGDVWFRVTLRMLGWCASRADLMTELGNAGKIDQDDYDDFSSRLDTLWAWVRDGETFSAEDIDFAWRNRVAQSNFKPPFDHYRRKYLPK
jgi:hypothetical protein